MFQQSLMIHKKKRESKGVRRKVDALKTTKMKIESKIPMTIILIQIDPKKRRQKKKVKVSQSPNRPRQLPRLLLPPSLRIKSR